jgi:hypothetical protein
MNHRVELALTVATVVGLHAPPVLADDSPDEPSAAPLQQSSPPPEQVTAPDQTVLRHRAFVYESFGFNAVTYTGPSGKVSSSTITPGDKVVLFEQAGIGYWVHPNIRLQVTGMFGETVTGLKPGASSFTLGAVIPCVFYTNGGFFAGGGPMFAPRAFGTDGFNFGIFSVAGYAFSLGHGLTLAGAVQAPVMLAQKDSLAITPAIVFGERF